MSYGQVVTNSTSTVQWLFWSGTCSRLRFTGLKLSLIFARTFEDKTWWCRDGSLTGINWHKTIIAGRESPAASLTPSNFQILAAWWYSRMWLLPEKFAGWKFLRDSQSFCKRSPSRFFLLTLIIFTESWHLPFLFCLGDLDFCENTLSNVHFKGSICRKCFAFKVASKLLYFSFFTSIKNKPCCEPTL